MTLPIQGWVQEVGDVTFNEGLATLNLELWYTQASQAGWVHPFTEQDHTWVRLELDLKLRPFRVSPGQTRHIQVSRVRYPAGMWEGLQRNSKGPFRVFIREFVALMAGVDLEHVTTLTRSNELMVPNEDLADWSETRNGGDPWR